MSAILIVAAALLIDRLGELPNRLHPLRWIGNLVGFLDRRVKDRASRWTVAKGLLSYMIVFLATWLAMMLACGLVRTGLDGYQWEAAGVSVTLGEAVWVIVVAFMFKVTFAVFSFRHHCKPIQGDLTRGDVPAARDKVQMIVSRDASLLDEGHITSACCETISENLVDSAMSPAFYFGFLGVTGAVMFRCANLMDAMWGYLNDRYGNLGFFVAKFDDALGFLTSRLSPAFVALAALARGYESKGVVKAAREGHSMTPSPNSGWPMTAVACAMGISMEKEGVYVMGEGALPSIGDVTRCYKLVERISMLFMLTVTVVAFALLGVYIQVAAEDWLLGLLGMMP